MIGAVPDVHAAIDIGTNSIHLLVARLAPDGSFEVIAQEKEQVRLGSGSGDMRKLETDAIDRGIAALRRFRLLAEGNDADITAVATSAVREAENRREFLDRAQVEAGVHVEVISGVEEARLIHLGVVQAVPVHDDRTLCIDIGGGSTEYLVGTGVDMIDARSMKLGAIRLTDRFFPEGEIRPGAVADASDWIDYLLAPVAHQFQVHRYTAAVGSSGTIENVAEMIERRRGNHPATVNGLRISRAEVQAVLDELASHATARRRHRKVAGLDPARADTIVAGTVLLERTMRTFDLDELTVSTYALREGLFLDRFRRERGAHPHHLRDIRRSSVQRLARLFDEDRDHVEHSTDLALRLFDDLVPVHGLGGPERELLEAAGWVHNVGLFISHSAHHKHSYYVIRNSDRLAGFTDHEIEIIAQVARYHRRSAPKAKHAEFAALSERDQRTVRVLAGVLRLGIALDRNHDGRVSAVAATIDEPIVVSIESSGEDALERYTFNERRSLLTAALGREIVLA